MCQGQTHTKIALAFLFHSLRLKLQKITLSEMSLLKSYVQVQTEFMLNLM